MCSSFSIMKLLQNNQETSFYLFKLILPQLNTFSLGSKSVKIKAYQAYHSDYSVFFPKDALISLQNIFSITCFYIFRVFSLQRNPQLQLLNTFLSSDIHDNTERKKVYDKLTASLQVQKLTPVILTSLKQQMLCNIKIRQ